MSELVPGTNTPTSISRTNNKSSKTGAGYFWSIIRHLPREKILTCYNNNMDSLTARVISTSGLSRVYPLLPPVHNIGMIYLKEPFGDAEILLHEARVALDKFEESDIPANKDALYDAMAKLEVKEAHYFGTTRFGFNKPMFVGWRKELFKAKIREMKNKTTARWLAEPEPHALAMFSGRKCVEAWNKLSTIRTGISRAAVYIMERVHLIEKALKDLQGRATSDASLQPDLKLIADSLRDTKACHRLESLIAEDQWILPHDLGV